MPSRSERAPAYYELFANGVHVATGSFERGDPTLGLERAHGIDVGLKWEAARSHVHLNAFRTRFSNYIALQATGDEFAGDEGSVPIYAFSGVPAQLQGLELEGRWGLPLNAGWDIALLGQFDAVRGRQRDTGEALPRLAPQRAMLGLEAQHGPWAGRVELRGFARQDRVPALDTATPGGAIWHLALTRSWQMNGLEALGYLRTGQPGRSPGHPRHGRRAPARPGTQAREGLELGSTVAALEEPGAAGAPRPPGPPPPATPVARSDSPAPAPSCTRVAQNLLSLRRCVQRRTSPCKRPSTKCNWPPGPISAARSAPLRGLCPLAGRPAPKH